MVRCYCACDGGAAGEDGGEGGGGAAVFEDYAEGGEGAVQGEKSGEEGGFGVEDCDCRAFLVGGERGVRWG